MHRREEQRAEQSEGMSTSKAMIGAESCRGSELWVDRIPILVRYAPLDEWSKSWTREGTATFMPAAREIDLLAARPHMGLCGHMAQAFALLSPSNAAPSKGEIVKNGNGHTG
jgi:hypothetical protein